MARSTARRPWTTTPTRSRSSSNARCSVNIVQVLWSPDGRDSVMRRFAERNGFTGFDALQRWSVTEIDAFGRAVADFYGIGLDAERVLGARAMPGAEWFPGATVNY